MAIEKEDLEKEVEIYKKELDACASNIGKLEAELEKAKNDFMAKSGALQQCQIFLRRTEEKKNK